MEWFQRKFFYFPCKQIARNSIGFLTTPIIGVLLLLSLSFLVISPTVLAADITAATGSYEHSNGYGHHDNHSGVYNNLKNRTEWAGAHKGCHIRGQHHHRQQSSSLNCLDAYASPAVLWPANHKFEAVLIKGLRTSNGENPRLSIECVMQDESLDSEGSGNTDVDAQRISDHEVLLRKERAGGGNGRVYHIDFVASDVAAGESCRGSVAVEVPHHKHGKAQDDGRLFSSIESSACGDASTNTEPEISSEPVAHAVATAHYYYAVLATDVDGDILGYSLSKAPAGMSINSDGHIEWLPDAGQVGSFAVVVTVDDGRGGSVEQSFTLVVAPRPNAAPIISSVPELHGVEAQAYQYQITATDADGDELVYVLLDAPLGMTINAEGLLQWTPPVGSAGDHRLLLQVSDKQGAIAEQSFTLSIAPKPNAAPAIISAPVIDAVEGRSYHYTVVGFDSDGDPLTFSLLSAPTTMQLTVDLLSWTPDYNSAGEHIVTVAVHDVQGGVASQSFTVTVVDSNRAPDIVSTPLVEATEGQLYQYALQADDADGDALTYAVIAAPVGLSINNEGLINWIPGYDEAGQYTIAVVVTDGKEGSSQQSYTLNVVDTNRDPQIHSLPVTTASEGQLYTYQLVAADDDGDDLIYTLNTALPGMTVDAQGLVEWSVDYDSAGVYGIEINVTDSKGAIVSQNFSLRVADVNRSPLAYSVSLNLNEDTSMAVSLGGFDADGDQLTFQITQAPANGILTGTVPHLSYRPESDFHGSDSFSYRVSDGVSVSNEASVSLTINPGNDPPQFADFTDALTIMPGALFSLELNATDPEANTILYSIISGSPAGMTINNNSGALSWIPTAADTGSYTIVLQASDGELASSATLRLQVVAAEEVAGSMGTSFWLSNPLNSSRNVLHISSDSAASGFVDLQGSVVNFTIPEGGGFWTYDIYRKWSTGIYIEADNKVSVNLLAYSLYKTDAYTVFPEHALGLRHRIASYNQNVGSFFNVIGTEDMTVVEITPSARYRLGSSYYDAGTPFSILLNQGESYQLKSVINDVGFTGSLVESDKPVMVVGGHDCTYIPHGFGFCDPLLSQMPATELWAKEYYLVPLASRLKGDVVRVIADEDDTYISINELIVRRIDAGEFYEFTLTEPAIVSGSKPVLVAQYSTGTQVDNYERSLYPNGKLLTNIRDNGLGDNLIHQVAVNPALGVNYILVVKPSSETVVTLNGEPVDANLFQRLPTSYGGYYLAQIALPEGNYEVASDRPIIALDNTEYLTYFSDPAMMMVPPKAHYINRYSFVVPASEMPRNFINVVVPSDSIDSVVIDDEIIDARYFNVMEGSDYSYARLGVNIGHHVITAAKPFGLASYGFTADTSYAAIGGRRSLAGMDLAAINIASPSTTATMGEEYCVDFFTVDRSSKALGYITVDVVVNDEQASRARVVTDENGVGQYCYLALNSGKHTLSLSNNAIRANALIEWVSEPSNQLPPTITSMPVLVGGVGNHYSYAVKVDDPNSNASFTYQLLAHPDGMTIDPEGMISWPLAVRGRYTVAIEVMDETGLTAVQTYQLRINALPFVRTEPIKVIDMGTEYHSSILFDDADGVAGLTYELMSAPAEISVRTDFINGFYRVIIVIKTQTLAAGTYPVSFRITDVEGGVLDYSYDLLISNVAPRFTSTEWLVEGVAGERLSTVVKALDVADVVTYSFAGPVPVGMSINATTGLIEWLTALESPLVTRVTVVATDSYGVSISHALTFQLTETNKPVAFSDQQYRFQIPLTDPLGGLLSYELIDGPPSMTIDPQGVISWLPGAGEIGGYPVSVRITDSQGNESIYEFELMVALKADFPTILSEPITTADTEKPYRYPVKAFDPEGNRLSYWVSGSGDIAFDADTQLITWQPTLSEVGLQTITLSVSDDQGHSTEQQFTVRVTAPGPWNRRRCR